VINVRSHIEVDQAAVRSAGVGQLLVRICPAHVYSQAPDGSLVVQHTACLKCGLPCPGASQDAPLARSARRFRRGIPRAVAGISERLYAANALELRRDSATRVRVGP
jgi:ferredoxin like protein